MTIAEQVTRESLIVELAKLELDWGDEEDAVALVDVLLRRFTPFGAWTWLAFWSDELGGLPILLLREGRAREVTLEARRLCES